MREMSNTTTFVIIIMRRFVQWLFNPASLFLASSNSTIPGSASCQRERNFEIMRKKCQQPKRIFLSLSLKIWPFDNNFSF